MSGVTSNTTRRIRKVATLPATCAVGEVVMKTSGGSEGLYVCLVANTWSGPLDSTSDTGDFVGPASSTDNALVRFDGAGGKTGQNSVVLVGDTGNVTGLGTLNTHTLPAGTDTLVGRASTDTLTNKTLTSPAITTPTGIVKGDVGLGNVDNTSDASKPVSTATQTALDLKVDKATVPVVLVLACSDESTAIAAATGKLTFRMPHAMTVTAVRASLKTAAATGTFTVDINEGGTTILSTKLTIDATEKTSTTAATPAVISDAVLADDAEITIDVDNAGDGAAVGLKVTLIGTRSV